MRRVCSGRRSDDRFVSFSKRVNPNGANGCWDWIGYVMPNGYGTFKYGSVSMGTMRNSLAHRFSYNMFRGPIPDELCIDHLCRNRKCVNPNHLQAVTQKQNNARSLWPNGLEKKYFCKRGHKMSSHNVVTRPNGWRYCVKCQSARGLAFYYNKKEIAYQEPK